MDTFIFLLILIYFPSAMGALYFLMRVIVPRVKNNSSLSSRSSDNKIINPTFFGGISQFETPEEYGEYLKKISKDEDQLYQMFAGQVFTLGSINTRKNQNVRKAMFFMVAALTSELLIIMNLAYKRAYSYLSEDTIYYVIALFIVTVLVIFIFRMNFFSK
mgnify:FL=1